MPATAEPRRRGVLPALPPAAARSALSPPRLPAPAVPAAALAREAATLALPVRIEAGAASGRALLARALHAESGRPGPLIVAEGRCRAMTDLPPGASVLVDLETLTVPAAVALEALIDDAVAWLLLATPPGAELPAALAPRLAVTLCVPPLHARSAELPVLARYLVSVLCGRRGSHAPDLTPAALDWLATQAWPGDVAELEATLGRALLRAGSAAIDRHHLTDAVSPPSGNGRQVQLEFLIAQLAHELRNPLSAMKAFAQLPGLADDPALRARFAALTDESIARMDGLLEHAATFARLGTPAPTDVELGPLLDGLVGEIRPALAERAIALEYASPNGARCTADRAQLAYAMRSVLDGVARDARADAAVCVDAAMPGVVRIEFDDRNGTTDRLRRAVVDGAAASESLPLAFALARAVLEQNGGGLALATQPDGRAVLELRLPGDSTRGG
jgi:hypothetical protein